MSQNIPTVSVIMCVRNGKRYVEAAVRSLLVQTFRDFELIVIDDGSTDATPGILDQLAQADERVRVVHQDPRGIPASANHGLSLARGQYIARQDSDDLSHPDRLACEVEYLEAHPQVVCVSGYVQMMDARGRTLTTLKVATEHERIEDEMLRGHCSIWHTMSMMRRDALQQVGGYDENFPLAEDIELFLRLSEIGRVANLPRAVGKYRLHGGGVSETRRQQEQDLCRMAVEKASARRGIASRFEAHQDWRPGADAASRLRFTCQYGWWAFNSGHKSTAMIYGLKAIGMQPWSAQAWKLLLVASLKRPAAKPVTGKA